MTYYNEDKQITHIKYNWFYTPDGEGYDAFTVGRQINGKTPITIKEHSAQGEGDKWFYDVFFDDGSVTRVFNPNSITFTPIQP